MMLRLLASSLLLTISASFKTGQIKLRHGHHLFARPKSAQPAAPIVASKITERLLQLTSNPDIAILIDVENIRGKTNFELTHSELLDRLMIWASFRNHAFGRTIAVIDHGSKPTAHLLSRPSDNNNGICVTFAGPVLKADDIIARDTKWLLDETSVTRVIVFTADRELSFRSRNAASADSTSKMNWKLKKKEKKAMFKRQNELLIADAFKEGTKDNTANSTSNKTDVVNVISSLRLHEDMEQAMKEFLMNTTEGQTTNQQTNEKASRLFQLLSKIVYLESALRRKLTARKRLQLTYEMRKHKEEWKAALFAINDNDHMDNETLCDLTAISLALNVPSQISTRNSSVIKETTEDRTKLAEMTRCQLKEVIDANAVNKGVSLIELYADYINNMNKVD
jgi:hypothetical protein